MKARTEGKAVELFNWRISFSMQFLLFVLALIVEIAKFNALFIKIFDFQLDAILQCSKLLNFNGTKGSTPTEMNFSPTAWSA